MHGDVSSAVLQFLSRYGLVREPPTMAYLERLARAYSNVPFENLTKVIRLRDESNAERARRNVHRVVRDHVRWGTGGTCFALTAGFLDIVRWLGFRAEPILADRRYGENTHSALVVWLDNAPFLVDPGYLILSPVPLHMTAPMRIPTSFNELELIPLRDPDRVELYTHQHDGCRYRLTFKTTPVDWLTFVRAWVASFGAEMLRYPVVTMARADTHYYFQKNNLIVRNRNESHRVRLTGDNVLMEIEKRFGISHVVVRDALIAMGVGGIA